MEVEAAARRHLLADRTVRGYSSKVFKHRLEEKVEDSGGMAFVVSRNHGWRGPDEVSSREFPILRIECIADPSRDENGDIKKADAADKALAGIRAVIGAFTWEERGRFMGAVGSDPGLLVDRIRRRGEPWLTTRADEHGSGRAIVETLGETVKATVEFNLTVVH